MTESSELSVLSLKKRTGKVTRSQEEEKNLVALCSLGALIVSSIGVFISLFTLGVANRIASKPLPVLVQTLNGKNIKIRAEEGRDRSPKAIKFFVTTTLTSLFTWRVHYLTNAPDEPQAKKIDPGVPVEVTGGAALKIPASVWGASFAVSDEFRKDFIGKDLAPMITQLKIIQGSSYVAFMPSVIQDPIEVKTNNPNEKLWMVKVVANLVVKTNADVPETLIPFNKDIYVRAIDPPIPPEIGVDPETDLQAVIALARSKGLEIYGMEEFSAQKMTK
jgi:hypothetical protein